MVRSGKWTDRNKASFALLSLTESRDPQLLALLKSEASDALMEMANWRAIGWASPARVILARVAGIPEERIKDLASAPDFSLDALTRDQK
jgi:hypothetical protein